ncbi:MAG: Beta-hexosaminidase [Candidatus Ordinivivax streblomastigis]|uniref:Beta-hexosaminidase n=1 Tax=Candidatus Ordinivivax streblomastigis TaxID=2540710 RepID=A0A5M8NZN8_9BACT|nr:MAG: Beta-hexosaminidase [Candidatus Ordinivivax streblomastigis]
MPQSKHSSFQVRRGLAVVFFIFIMATSKGNSKETPQNTELKHKIGQMLIIGFHGMKLQANNHIITDIQQRHISGVILFDYDAPSKKYGRNISNPKQLKQLSTDLQKLTNEKLIISIDQEGGKVNRLKAKYGFPASVSAEYLGKINNEDSTRYYASICAKTLKAHGINLNFAPCVDVNLNPKNPIIGGVQRSFSKDTTTIIRHAQWWLETQQSLGVIGSLKHFPGHGSSSADTHLGNVDVSKTWNACELAPYRQLIQTGQVHVVMTSHIFNAHLDPHYPATLSKAILTDILRKQLHFKGVIITDDLAMGALVKNYSLEAILEHAINAGADLLCLSNNGETDDPFIAQKAVDIIFKLVKSGKIAPETIDASYKRIQELKSLL